VNRQEVQVFLEIVEHRSISAAAQSLHYTQSTVSNYLAQLEKKLGAQLIQRRKGIRITTLTQAGADFLPIARKLMEVEAEVDRFIAEQNRPVFRIAASKSGHEHVVSHIVNKMRKRIPDVEIRLSSAETHEIPLFTEERSFDAALIYCPAPVNSSFSAQPLFAEERCILCPSDTPLPEGIVSTEELDPSCEVLFNNYTTSRDAVSEWHRTYFPNYTKPFFSISSLGSAPLYMTDPKCWTLMPVNMALALVARNQSRLVMRRVEPAPPSRICSVMLSNDYPDQKVINAFLESCEEYIEEREYLQRP